METQEGSSNLNNFEVLSRLLATAEAAQGNETRQAPQEPGLRDIIINERASILDVESK